MKRIIASLMVLFALVSCSCAQTKEKEASVIQMNKQMFLDKVFDYTTGATEWKYQGDKPAVIDFYATWCGPCQKELAEVQSTLWPKYKDNKNFVMLVIGREHTDEDLQKYNERKKFTFPLYPDPKREVFSLFAEKSIPRAYLFGKDGKLIYSSIGYTEEEFQKLMKTIESAL